ncbi:hypothetical protein Syun_003942 [Stephania yunnanensis]|uniref:Uncharacterized protein n=1 Tax=Stephania yunnanensis TaxID=152371 RepID=A0AAP0L330_9MAGN
MKFIISISTRIELLPYWPHLELDYVEQVSARFTLLKSSLLFTYFQMKSYYYNDRLWTLKILQQIPMDLTISQHKPSFSKNFLERGIDRLRPSLGAQYKSLFSQGLNRFQIMTPQRIVLANTQAQGNLGTSPTYGDTDPRRFRRNLNVKDGQPSGNERSISSPMQSSSPKVS